jgi:integrase
VLDQSPADGIPLPTREIPRDRVLSNEELLRIILAARQIGGAYGGIVELLALTGQRREEAARCPWDEIDLPARIWTLPQGRTKNAKPHIVHLSDQAVAVLQRTSQRGKFVSSRTGDRPFQAFSSAKRELDKICGVSEWHIHDLRRTCVSGMAALGVAPHVADKILNHQSGTISGVAAVYQRHQFLAERKEALERWGEHVSGLLVGATRGGPANLRRVA